MPANEYYDSSGSPSTRSAGDSSVMRAEFDALEAGFNKLPALAGNAGKAVVVNPGSNGMTVTAAALALAVAFTTAGAGAITLNSTAPTNVTLPTSGILISSAAALTAKSFSYVDALQQIASTAAPLNGEILIGSTGNIPVKAAIAGTANQVTVTNGAGTITLSLPNAITTPGSLTVTGTSTLNDNVTVAGGKTITLSGVAGQILASGGSGAASPAYSFNGGGNKGFFDVALNTIGVSISGGEIARFTTQGIQLGASVVQSSALLSAVVGGNGIEFGHSNTAGYRSTIGAEASSGKGFLAFSARAGTNANTYRTDGNKGTVIRGDVAGGLEVLSITTASADNQAGTSLMTLSTAATLAVLGGQFQTTNGGPGSPGAGVGNFGSTTVNGAQLIGQGTNNDVGLLNKNGTGALFIPTGTTNVTIVGAATVGTGGRIASGTDGIVTLTNAAATDFTRLTFGGTSSAFPSIRRSSTAIEVVLADNSAYTTFACGAVLTHGSVSASGGNYFIQDSGSDMLVGNQGAGNVLIYRSGSEIARFTGTSLGINTTPAFIAGGGVEIQTAAGIATLRLDASALSNAFELQVDSTANGVKFVGANNSSFIFTPNGSTALTLTGTGSVLFGGMTITSAGNLTNGVTVTSGSYASGNFTCDFTKGPICTNTNGAAFTLTAPAADGSQMILVTNNATAGAITFSGFTVGSNTGDSLTTTNGHKFIISVVRAGGTSTYSIKALQ